MVQFKQNIALLDQQSSPKLLYEVFFNFLWDYLSRSQLVGKQVIFRYIAEKSGDSKAVFSVTHAVAQLASRFSQDQTGLGLFVIAL